MKNECEWRWILLPFLLSAGATFNFSVCAAIERQQSICISAVRKEERRLYHSSWHKGKYCTLQCLSAPTQACIRGCNELIQVVSYIVMLLCLSFSQGKHSLLMCSRNMIKKRMQLYKHQHIWSASRMGDVFSAAQCQHRISSGLTWRDSHLL